MNEINIYKILGNNKHYEKNNFCVTFIRLRNIISGNNYKIYTGLTPMYLPGISFHFYTPRSYSFSDLIKNIYNSLVQRCTW